jgi:hypothetical protein
MLSNVLSPHCWKHSRINTFCSTYNPGPATPNVHLFRPHTDALTGVILPVSMKWRWWYIYGLLPRWKHTATYTHSARQWPWNKQIHNICYWITASKHACFNGNKRISGYSNEKCCILCGACWDVINRTSLETVSQLLFAVAETHAQFRNAEEEEHPPLDVITRRLMKTVTEDTSVSRTVICTV